MNDVVRISPDLFEKAGDSRWRDNLAGTETTGSVFQNQELKLQIREKLATAVGVVPSAVSFSRFLVADYEMNHSVWRGNEETVEIFP